MMTNNNSSTPKAHISTVNVGPIVFEGLMTEDGQYWIAAVQANNVLQFSQNPSVHGNVTKALKSLLGKGFPSVQLRTTLNSKAVTAIPLVEFERLIVELAIKGNPQAALLNRALVGLSLTQVFSDAFHVKFEEAHRQEWLDSRLTGKMARRSFTDALKEWLAENRVPQEQHVRYYAGCTNLIYDAVFGMTAARLVVARGCKPTELRNSLTTQELAAIERIEDNAAMLLDRGLNPQQAIEDSIAYWMKRRR